MTTYIALFRGINVGGIHTLPMKELMAILEGLGARSMQSYIQSGNVVFASQEKDSSRLAKKIGMAIKQGRGFEPQVLLLELKELEGLKKASERFRLIDTVFYLHAPDGVGRSKLAANAERFLGVPMTDRNWRTVTTLWKMAQGLK